MSLFTSYYSLAQRKSVCGGVAGSQPLLIGSGFSVLWRASQPNRIEFKEVNTLNANYYIK